VPIRPEDVATAFGRRATRTGCLYPLGVPVRGEKPVRTDPEDATDGVDARRVSLTKARPNGLDGTTELLRDLPTAPRDEARPTDEEADDLGTMTLVPELLARDRLLATDRLPDELVRRETLRGAARRDTEGLARDDDRTTRPAELIDRPKLRADER